MHGSLCNGLIERAAIDHVSLDTGGRVRDLVACGREKPGGRKSIEHRRACQIELAERIVGKHARAVDRLSDFMVLFEKSHGKAGPGEKGCRVKSSWPSSDDRNVQHLLVVSRGGACQTRGVFIIRARAARLRAKAGGRYSFRARTSQRPRNVIQNDTMTRNMSRRKVAFFT